MSDFPSAPPPPPSFPGPGSSPPPGYVAYGSTGTTGYTKPIRGLGKAVVVLQSIGVLGSLAALLVSFSIISKAEDFLDGNTSRSTFEDDLAPYLAVSLLAGAIAIATIVLLILWSFRIAKNLQAKGHDVTWKPGLTIVVWILGSCTLNIINFLMLREHWIKSDPDATYPNSASSRLNPLIIVWFVLTLLQVVTGFAAGLRNVGGFSLGNNTNNTAESLSDSFAISAASAVIGLAASVVLIMIVRQLTERHARFTGEA